MLSAYNSCPTKFFRQYVQHLLGEESTDLIAGGALARGLEVARKAYFNDGLLEYEAVNLGVEALLQKYGSHVPFKGNKTADKMAIALEGYFMEYPMARDQAQPAKLANGEFAIEYSFAHELPILHPILGVPLLFVGRADMLSNYCGSLWVQDEKTTSQITETWASQWETRGQFTGYAWGLRKDGIPVQGALIRGIGILKQSIKFIECTSVRTEFEIDAWEKMMFAQVQNMVNAYQWYLRHRETTVVSDYWRPCFNEACYSYFRQCSYTNLCKSKNAERFIDTEFGQNIWLPHIHERWNLDVYLQSLMDQGVLTQEQYDSL